jgi:four helix bundle protein
MTPRAAAKSIQDLLLWQKAHQFVLCLSILGAVPGSEIYALTSQFRRAAISIPANIAEGFGRRTKPDKVRFLNIAQGSLEECRYYLILAQDLGYGETKDSLNQLDEISRMLSSYTRTVASDF